MTAAAGLEDWLSEFTSTNTRDAYRRDVEAMMAWAGAEGLDPLALDRPAAIAYRQALLDQGLEHSSVDRKLAACRSFFGYCVERGAEAPLAAFAALRPLHAGGESTTPWLGAEGLRGLLSAAAIAGPGDFLLVALLGLSGLRVSEAVGADVDDLVEVGGHRALRIVRKGQKPGRIPLAPAVATMVDVYLDGRTSGPLLVRVDARGRRHRISRQGAWRRVKLLAVAAGVDPDISPHSLRHSFITLALAEGKQLHVVQGAAGHRSPATTQHYDRDRQVLEGNPTFDLAGALLREADDG